MNAPREFLAQVEVETAADVVRFWGVYGGTPSAEVYVTQWMDARGLARLDCRAVHGERIVVVVDEYRAGMFLVVGVRNYDEPDPPSFPAPDR